MENLIDLCIEDEADDLPRQIRSFEQADAQRNQLLQKLCQEIQDLKSTLAQRDLQHAREVQNCRTLEAEARNTAFALQESRRSMQNHSHVLVLLDGNTCFFRENLLQEGLIGGAEAAYHLHNEIKTYLQNYEGSKQWQIIVRVYVDLEALFQSLNERGYHFSKSVLFQFSRGFTQHQPLFDFIDVGRGCERVGIKIEELFKLSIVSVQCQHVLLGYGNHARLAKLFQPYRESILDAHRISLLKVSDFEAEPVLGSFPTVEFPFVFRPTDDSIGDFVRPEPSVVEHSASSDLTEDSEKSTVHDYALTRQSSSSSISDKAPKSQQPISIVNLPSAAPSGFKRSSSWNPNRGIVLLNVNDERIDADLGRPEKEAEQSVRKRHEQARMCNDFHLRNICTNPSCPFSHEPRLSPAESIALRYLARRLLCQRGSACRGAECWYGHMCLHETCYLPNTCRFRAFHGMDHTAVTVWQISGPRSWVPPGQ